MTIPDPVSPLLPDPRREVWIAGDESGTLQFDNQPNDRYFLVATVAVDDPALWTELESLRLELGRTFSRTGRDKPFHANKDPGQIRHRVIDLMVRYGVVVEATLVDKTTLPVELRANRLALYTVMWAGHLARVLPRHFYPNPKVTLLLGELGAMSKVEACEMAVRNATGAAYLPHLCRTTMRRRSARLSHGRWRHSPDAFVVDAPSRWPGPGGVLTTSPGRVEGHPTRLRPPTAACSAPRSRFCVRRGIVGVLSLPAGPGSLRRGQGAAAARPCRGS
jgi:hypothetical protein